MAVLLLLFAAVGAAFMLVQREALETQRERLLSDTHSHFAARVAALDRSWLESGYAIGQQLDLWQAEAGGLAAEVRAARLRTLMATLLDQGAYSHAAIVGADGKTAFQLGTRSQDALALPETVDSRGLGWVYSERDRTAYRTVSSPVHPPGRPVTLVLYVPLDNALLGRLAYPLTQLELQRQGVRIAASGSVDRPRNVGMSDEPQDERAVVMS